MISSEPPLRMLFCVGSLTAGAATTSRSIFDYFSYRQRHFICWRSFNLVPTASFANSALVMRKSHLWYKFVAPESGPNTQRMVTALLH